MARVISKLCLMYVTPQFTTSDPLRSGSTGFEAGQRIQFQSRSADLNWLAVLTESVYKLELQAATGDRYDAALTETLTLGYLVENWRVTTRRREAMLSLESVYIQSSS